GDHAAVQKGASTGRGEAGEGCTAADGTVELGVATDPAGAVQSMRAVDRAGKLDVGPVGGRRQVTTQGDIARIDLVARGTDAAAIGLGVVEHPEVGQLVDRADRPVQLSVAVDEEGLSA